MDGTIDHKAQSHQELGVFLLAGVAECPIFYDNDAFHFYL